MKKPRIFFFLAALLVAVLPGAAPAAPSDMSALFPGLDGWQKQGGSETYLPDNLYEHIDGAAENFLAYGFARLAVQNYANEKKQSLSAEIYFHGTPENAFGIYGSEKPLAGNYIPVGAEGYVEEGVLNFISGAYYVKLNGFDLGAGGTETLKSLAARIAQAIGGDTALPGILAVLPPGGRIPHSERYIAGNFLGHEFLLPAFTADYERQGKKFQLFIMKAGDEEKARAMLQRYAALDKEGAAPEIRPGDLTIRDPYNGPVRLCWRGTYVWGVSGQVAEAAAFIAEIARSLERR
jgi:hypothetical protein